MKSSSLMVPIVDLAKDFFNGEGSGKILETALKGIDEIFIDNPENDKFKSLDIKTKDGKIDKVRVEFGNGDSFSYDRNKREVQDALIFINN